MITLKLNSNQEKTKNSHKQNTFVIYIYLNWYPNTLLSLWTNQLNYQFKTKIIYRYFVFLFFFFYFTQKNGKKNSSSMDNLG